MLLAVKWKKMVCLLFNKCKITAKFKYLFPQQRNQNYTGDRIDYRWKNINGYTWTHSTSCLTLYFLFYRSSKFRQFRLRHQMCNRGLWLGGSLMAVASGKALSLGEILWRISKRTIAQKPPWRKIRRRRVSAGGSQIFGGSGYDLPREAVSHRSLRCKASQKFSLQSQSHG